MPLRPMSLMPGGAIEIQEWVFRAEFFVEPSSDYLRGTPTSPISNSAIIQVATDADGPWANITVIGIPQSGANTLSVGAADNRYFPFIRAILEAEPTTGSVSVSAYVRVREG